MPQHITLAEVKKAGRNYYNRGLLTAQHRDPNLRQCEYRIGDYRCVIGSVLTSDTLDTIENAELNEMGICASGMDQHITFDDDERPSLVDLQQAHDAWAQAAACVPAGAKEDTKATRLRQTFVGLLFAD